MNHVSRPYILDQINDVLYGDRRYVIICADMLEVCQMLPDLSVDLTVTSPPYDAARTYGIGFKKTGWEFIDWCLDRYQSCYWKTKGVTAWVMEGQTKQFEYSGSPFILFAELHRRGLKMRKPPIYERDGIPGSGGPDWFKNRYEPIICAAHGKLPYSNNTACGHPPKYGPGGHVSHRNRKGERCFNRQTRRNSHGNRDTYMGGRPLPELSNPGNIVDCGANTHFGKFAHENEAPFPEKVPELFIKSCCPPNGVVFDPFLGSGTSMAVALKNGRKCIGVDIRQSQCELTLRRIREEVPANLRGDQD